MADVRHKNGKPTGNAQGGVADITALRNQVPAYRSRAGLAQMENINAGDRGPERRGGKTPHHPWYYAPNTQKGPNSKPMHPADFAAKKTAKKKK